MSFNDSILDQEYPTDHLGLVKSKKAKIKLLGQGDIKVKIDIEVSAFSKSAKDSVEKIGGSVIIFDDKKKSISQNKKTGV